jgi:hypothetical protein
MAISPKCLIEPTLLTASNASYYTATKGVTIIDKMTVTNVTTLYETVTVYLVPSGITPAGSHRIAMAISIAPSETYEFTKAEGHVLNTGDSIQAFSSTASALSFRVSGREVLI